MLKTSPPKAKQLKLLSALGGMAAMIALAAPAAHAAKSDGCTGGGFVISGLLNGINVPAGAATTIPASNIGPSFQILGKYVEFNVVSATFGVENYTSQASPAPKT